MRSSSGIRAVDASPSLYNLIIFTRFTPVIALALSAVIIDGPWCVIVKVLTPLAIVTGCVMLANAHFPSVSIIHTFTSMTVTLADTNYSQICYCIITIGFIGIGKIREAIQDNFNGSSCDEVIKATAVAI
jgi:hypothetical protein